MYQDIRTEIINDLKTLNYKEFINKWYNINLDNQEIILDEWCGVLIPPSILLNYCELDTQLNLIYYNERLYGGNNNYMDANSFLFNYLGY